MGGVFLLGIIVFVLGLVINSGMKSKLNTNIQNLLAKENDVDNESINNENIDSEILVKLKDMAKTNDKVLKVLKYSNLYPEELLELLANNEEAADFVLDFPEKKNAKPEKNIGEIKKGEIPLLLQWDERWGYATYSDNIIAINGCGPTALSMVASGLTGDSSITPYKVAKYAEKNGYYVEGTGTSWSLMTEGCLHFGVQSRELVLDQNIIFAELENGNPIICSMRPGDFTTTGHFIVLTGTDGGKIQVNDPNSKQRSKLWEYDTLEYQINNLWVFTKS